jgi:hypothetical protein
MLTHSLPVIHFPSYVCVTCPRERCEARVFQALLKLCHGLEEQLLNASTEEVELIADLVRHAAEYTIDSV